MTNNAHFIAKLKYRTAEEGGRTTGVISGYRPTIKFPFEEMLTSGQQFFMDKEKVFPGDIVTAAITIVSVDKFKKKLYPGLEFDFTEGSTITGSGKILEVLNKELIKES